MRLLRGEEKETISCPFKGSVEATVSEALNLYLCINSQDCIASQMKGERFHSFLVLSDQGQGKMLIPHRSFVLSPMTTTSSTLAH